MSRALRAVTALLVAGLCCLLAAVLLPGSADADAHHDVTVSVAGGPFVPFSARPLLDVSALAPGRSTSAVLGVRSGMHGRADLLLDLHGVHDDDNGCVGPERAVDETCGRGGGDLGHALRFTIATSLRRHGTYTERWSGPAVALEQALDTHMTVPADAVRWVRMAATLPARAGSRVESDTFRFGLTVILRGRSGTGGAGVGGKHVHRHHGSSGGGPLANTGVTVTVLAGIGALLIVVGLLVLATTWRRARRRWGMSDQVENLAK